VTKKGKITTSHEEEDTTVVQFLVARLNEYDLAEQFGRELKGLLDRRGAGRIVLDCTDLDYAISEVFCSLIEAANRLKRAGGSMVTCNLNPFLRDVYTTMRLDALIPVYGSLDEALQR